MTWYTCITENRGHSHSSQHNSGSPEYALREHIASLPFFGGINPIGDELFWLQSISLGKAKITLHPIQECKQVWKWQEGEQYSPSYITFIITTVIND